MRRGKGSGGLIQRHDHPTCPPLVDGERPDHRCKGRWVGTFDVEIDGKKRRKYVYADSQKAARIKLATALRQKQDGTLLIGTTTVEQWMTRWLERKARPPKALKPQTLRSYRSKSNTYIVPALGRRRLSELRPTHVDEFYDSLRDRGLAEATIRQTHAILSKALNDAKRKGLLIVNPVDLADPPGTEKAKRRQLTLAQAHAALDAAGDDPRWWLALFCGMRQGEVLGLRWEDINFTTDVLTIAQTLQTDEDGSLIFGEPKSGAGARSWPMPPKVAARLRRLWEPARPTTGLVFARADGSPIRPRDDWQAWRDFLDASDLPGVALHAARNSASSVMEAARIPDRLAAQILGHATVQMTHSYQEADHDRIAAAWVQMDAVLELE
jgi:integrase